MSDKIEALNRQINELNKQIEELRHHKERLDLVIKATGVGIWDWMVQTGELSLNERWANIIGYSLEEISPTSVETWIKYAHPEDLKESDRLLKENWAGESEYYIFESRMKHKNGSWIWVYDTGRVTEWESEGVPKRMIGTHMDINEQKNTQLRLDEANAELERLVRIDPLSKIHNRRAYDERLTSALAASKRLRSHLSLLIIDIDHFKKYNDTYGHDQGDSAIQAVAAALKNTLPRDTDFVARYGGEEFVIILPFTDYSGACVVCEEILTAITSLEIEHKGSQCSQFLSVSIGVSSTKSGAANLFKEADEALYIAKANGRNQYRIYETNASRLL